MVGQTERLSLGLDGAFYHQLIPTKNKGIPYLI